MSHGLSPAEFEVLGKSYYRKKEYRKALEAFASGIDASVIPTVSLYDYRAATHEKLADFNAAVKDGREAIRLNKRDVRGYLRTGSVLQKLNKLETAVNIYKYGMKNVSVDNKDFKLLQQLHDRLTRKLSPIKAVDPFSVLPVELVEMVLGYLSFKNVVSCLRVSRAWKNYLSKRPKLWQNLDLSGATKPVSRVFIRNAVRYSEATVTSLIVHRFQHTDVLRNIATACKRLHTIEILSLPIMLSDTLIEVVQCAANLKKLIIHTDISLDAAMQLLRYRPTLEHLELHSILRSDQSWTFNGQLPDLHTLQLKAKERGWADMSFVPRLIQLAPSLLSLSVVNWGPLEHLPIRESLYVPPLTTLNLKNVDLVVFPQLPNTLKRLVFHPKRSMVLPTGPPDIDILESWNNALSSHTAHLEHLAISGVTDLSPQFLGALLDIYPDENGGLINIDNPQNLQSLSLGGQVKDNIGLFGDSGLCASSRMITSSLASLNVSTLTCVDRDIDTLVALAKNVQSIDVSSTRVTGASLKTLADSMPNLRHLKANDCPNISSRDAVIYAERRGIVVSCSNTQSLSGRKVRHGLF